MKSRSPVAVAVVFLLLSACLTAMSNVAFTVKAIAQEEPQSAAAPPTAPANSYAIAFAKPIPISVRSEGVVWHGHTYHLVALGQARFHCDSQARLTATLSGEVTTFDNVDYDVHVAVFDAQGRLLGTSKAVCPVPRIWVGVVGTTPRTLEFDFGINRDYTQARSFTVAISSRKVLTPADWQK